MAKSQPGAEITDADLMDAEDVVDDDQALDAADDAPRTSEDAWLGKNKVAQPVPPSQPAPLPQVSAGETFINRAANNVPLGRLATDLGVTGQMAASRLLGKVLPDSLSRSLPGVLPEPGAKLTPEAAKALLAMGAAEEKPYEPDLLDLYRGLRDNRTARTEIGSEQNPIAGIGGAATGLGLSVLAPIPGTKFKVGGEGMLGKIATGGVNGLLTGGINGAIAGATDGHADTAGGDFLGTAIDTSVGAMFGGLTGGMFGAAAPPSSALLRGLYRGFVTPTKAAQTLRDKGVELTTGQMDPDSVLGQLEEVSTSVGGVGPSITAQREAGKQSWRNVVMNEALPPGMTPPDPALPVDERLAAMYDGFVPAYAPAKGANIIPQTSQGVPLIPPKPVAPNVPAPAPMMPLPRAANGRWMPGAPRPSPAAPQAVPGIFDAAVDDPNILASAGDRADVRDFLANQLTIATQNAKGGKVSSDAILEMRHNIRREINQALKSQNNTQARLLQNAEGQLTDVLETSLPNDAFEALQAADAQYARYKPLESAIAAAGDQTSGFSPTQLSNAIKSSMGDKGAYARGAGGEMRDLASAGKKVFDTRSAPTGARIMGMGPFQWIGAPMSFAANLKPVQKALLGEYGWQKGLSGVDDAVSGALNRLPSEEAAREGLSSMGMGNSVEDRSRTPESIRFQQQVVSNPDAFGPYAERLQQAAQQGPNQLAMQDFLLSSDPEYLRQRKAAAGQGE